jgi:hypothetical protein
MLDTKHYTQKLFTHTHLHLHPMLRRRLVHPLLCLFVQSHHCVRMLLIGRGQCSGE